MADRSVSPILLHASFRRHPHARREPDARGSPHPALIVQPLNAALLYARSLPAGEPDLMGEPDLINEMYISLDR